MDTKTKAIYYWQDRLAKFFATSKGPTNVEIDMFVAGYRLAQEEAEAKKIIAFPKKFVHSGDDGDGGGAA